MKAHRQDVVLDDADRRLINTLQVGFPICASPYAAVGAALDLPEAEVIARIERLLAAGVLTRFGPMFHAERLGGALSLVAMAVPPERFEAVAAQVNAHPQVAHNYEREHTLNMWFVLATPTSDEIAQVLAAIEAETGLPTFNMPKREEFHVGLHLSA